MQRLVRADLPQQKGNRFPSERLHVLFDVGGLPAAGLVQGQGIERDDGQFFRNADAILPAPPGLPFQNPRC